LFVNSSPSAVSPLSQGAATSDLFDQSALSTLAQRLVEAAKRAGADAADAVAVRGVAQGVEVRDGRVEESERSEGDDVGLRVLVGQRQAVVSTNDISGDGIAKLAERAVAMARVAPDDKYVGLADPSLLARDFPNLDLLDPVVPTTAELERRACEAEAAGLAVKGVTKSGGASASTGIGGMVLVTSTGFQGSYLRSSQGISMTAISGDGTGMERDYDFTSAPHASDLSSPESVGRKAGERTVARANPRKVETCKVPVVFDPRVAGSIVGHLVGAVNGASIARKTSFLKDRLGDQLFPRNIRIIDDPLRVRGLRSQTFDAEGVKVKKLAIIDEGVLTSWLLDSATGRELGLATTGHAQRGVSSSPSPGVSNPPLQAYSVVQPRHFRILDRERRDHLCRERGHDRRPPVRDLQVAGAGQRSGVSLRRQCADLAHRGIDAWRTLIPAPRSTSSHRPMPHY
jgi:PmbA protein